MLKKMMLLALAVGALVAFAAPAVASADIWTLDGAPVGNSTEEGVTFDGTGELAATRVIAPGTTAKLGPCVVHVHGTVWNEETGHGEVDNLEITTPCAVSINGTPVCSITKAFSENFPWTIEVTGGTAIDIYGANFTDVFSAECPLGPGAKASGTATGQFANGEPGSISFNSSGDLKTPEGAEVTLDGSVSLTATNGGLLALE